LKTSTPPAIPDTHRLAETGDRSPGNPRQGNQTSDLTSWSRATGPSSLGCCAAKRGRFALGWLATIRMPSACRCLILIRAELDEFRKALSAFATPSQNVVYADIDGNIGYQPMAFVPIRASGDGTVPVNGAAGKHGLDRAICPLTSCPVCTIRRRGSSPRPTQRSRRAGYPYQLATQWFRRIAQSASTKC